MFQALFGGPVSYASELVNRAEAFRGPLKAIETHFGHRRLSHRANIYLDTYMPCGAY